jgi:hypothetical protein
MATSASARATPPACMQGLWRRRDLSAALAASAMPGASWAIPAAVSASALQADLAILQRAYTALHPGLYRYNSPAEIDARFAALRREFATERTLAQAYAGFSLLAASIRCGHTYTNFYNQSDAVAAALLQGPRLPFHFRWLGSTMVVTRWFTPHPALRAGTEITAINGVPVARIVAELLPLGRADGHNLEKQRSTLEVQGRGRYEAFDVFYPMLFPFNGDRFRLALRPAEGGDAQQAIDVAAVPFSVRAAAADESHSIKSAPDAPAFTLQWLPADVALLRMPNWALYNSRWNWQGFIDESFVQMADRGTRHLIIDLRGNEGGLSVDERLLAHLTDRDLPAQPVQRLVRYRQVPKDIAPYLDTWDRSFFDWSDAAKEHGNGFYRLVRSDDDNGGAVRPISPRFGGRVWTIIGAVNSSATFEFARALRAHRLGTLVGQTTGGNQRGINGGAFFFLRLPNSGIELDLPLIGQFPAGDPPDAGLEPDIAVQTTIDDIAAGRDAELGAVMEAISRQPKS